MTATWWTARRVGDRILCGRQVPPGGPYACMGELAAIVRDMADNERIVPRPGLHAEWPEGVDGAVFRDTGKERLKGRSTSLGSGPMSIYTPTRQPNRYGSDNTIVSGWLPCSHRGHLNRIGRAPDEDTILPPFTGLRLI